MYIDQILFTVSAVLLLLFIVLLIVLIKTRRSSQEGMRFLHGDTQRIGVVNTLRQTNAAKSTEPLSGTPGSPETEVLPQAATEILPQAVTETLPQDLTLPLGMDTSAQQDAAVGAGLDLQPLRGKYTLLKEIHAGGMSRVFLARNDKLGNTWIVKFLDGHHAELTNEAEVMKKLNHISLPQIVDIFSTSQGTLLVESFVEGITLESVLRSGQDISEAQIADWGLQLAQVLRYLHGLDTPIIHCDLKPSNIMVTHDDRLVLIDFGISKRQGFQDRPMGITYRYAAPEQFRGVGGVEKIIRWRFGSLPPDYTQWSIDERTDLYSTGVILYELVNGRIPEQGKTDGIRGQASAYFTGVIQKCLQIRPEDRVQTADELVSALEQVGEQRLHFVRALTLRKIAAVCCGVFLSGSLVTSASAAYVYRQETMATVSLEPGSAVITVQQGVPLQITKTPLNGEPVWLAPEKIRWSYSSDNIAQIDGERLVGLNIGETTLYGQYRDKRVELNVVVTQPAAETAAISLQYRDDWSAAVYAGDGNRETRDGSLAACSFVSPEGLDWDGHTLYLTDSGTIRKIQEGQVTTFNLEPGYVTADRVRGWGGDIFVLTGPWEEETGESYYGFVRISGNRAEFLYYTDAAWSVIADIAFDSAGVLWYVQQNLGTGMTTLNRLDTGSLDSAWAADLPDGVRGMAFDENDTLYLTVPEQGVILRLGKGETSWSYFAGIEGQRDMIDGAVPCFYRPTSLAARDGALYVLDFDTVRKVTIDGKGALFTETLAGFPTADTNPEVVLGDGIQAVLPASELASITVDGGGRVLLSDPKNSVIYQITDCS